MSQTSSIRIDEEALVSRIRRVQGGRGDTTTAKTARALLHERLLELEENGDPAAIGGPGPDRNGEPSPAAGVSPPAAGKHPTAAGAAKQG